MTVPQILDLQAEDLKLLLAAKSHLGSKNANAKMKNYIFSRREDGIHLIHLGLLWEKLVLAARIIVAIEDPKDICIVSSCLNGRRAALKLAEYVGTTCFVDRYIPGTLTNPNVHGFIEPRLLISIDPLADAQIIAESRYCNIPVIALANSHSPLRHVDVAIPCNNISRFSIGVIIWLLARSVLRLRGSLPYHSPWDVKVDMFFYLEESEPGEITQTTQEWNEKPSWSKDDWNKNSSTFESQTNFGDKTFGFEDTTDNQSGWTYDVSNITIDFNAVFGQSTNVATDWADDTDIVIEPQASTKSSGGLGSIATPIKDNLVETGGWNASAFEKGNNKESTDGWDSSPPPQDDTGGWGAGPSNMSHTQRQWG